MGKKSKYLAAALTMAFLSAGCSSKNDENLGGGNPAGTAAGAMGSAIVSGKAVLNGKAPSPATIDMGADPTCKAQHSGTVKDDSVVQNANGTLQNVFVYVKEGAGNYPAPSTPVVLDQKGCMYNPHVLGVQVGQPLQIVNSDPTLHNVHCMPAVNDGFNMAQPAQGMKTSKAFAKPEVMVKMKCDVHSWMHCYVGVVSNPFFGVTGADGTFKITGLPSGTYTLAAWHEKYGTSEKKVEVKDGETKTVDFTFNAN